VGFFRRLLGSRIAAATMPVPAREARAKELSGDLASAAVLYEDAGLYDDAARVLLLRADAEPSAEKRIAFCALAAAKATSDELRRKAIGRKALVAFDVLKSRGASAMNSEVLAVARELEEAGEIMPAADAYALAGDAESEVRMLTAAGAIERLEERLRASAATARASRDLDLLLHKLDDLDRTAERRAALALAHDALVKHEDERVSDAARRIRARLARGPVVDLQIDGVVRRVALGVDVTLGRADATIALASRAVSRKHLRVFRGPSGAPFVEDLDTRNGTFLAGARVTEPLPVGDGVTVDLGNEVRCAIERSGAGVVVEVAGARYDAPLGPLVVGDWAFTFESAGGDAFVVLTTSSGGARPFLGEYQLAPRVELASGDALASERAGAARVRVLAPLDHEETTS
jgi:hypothetical protein